jgi:predicted metal-dependent peptidase
MKLKTKEVEFLVGHEVLHVVYDHMGRREYRDPKLFNIANDYAVNADLKRHKVGEFITSVPCLYEEKYDNKSSEWIYEDLLQNAQTMDLDSLIDKMIDEHVDESEDEDGEDSNGTGPKKMSRSEREELRREIKENILQAAKTAAAGELPKGVERLVQEQTNPTMPWRELIQTNLTSTIKNDYSFARPSRRSWHMDAIMPSMTPGEEIDICVALDMSGSISTKQASQFISEVAGMMDLFDGYRLHVFCFDTEVYAPADFNSDSMDSIDEYEPKGGGGTDFNAIFDYLKDRGESVKRLIVFTDGLPYGSWGIEDYTDVTWIIHGSKDIEPPFGTWAYFD